MKNKQLHPVQLQQALVPVSKMVIKFGLQCNEFQKNIQRAYIQAAEELIRESGIKVTNQAVAVKTGLDRRTISEFKKDSEKAKHQPLNKMDLIIAELQRIKVSNKRLSHSLLSNKIDKIYGGHIRSKAVITELLANQLISKNDKDFLVNESLNQQLFQQSQLADDVDITTKRLFQTFYKKMFANESSGQLNLSNIASSKIPNSQHEIFNNEVRTELLSFQKKMGKLISKYEANVPDGTYANVGFSQFQFDSNK